MARAKTEDIYPSQLVKILEAAQKKNKGDCPYYDVLRFDFTGGRKDSQGRVEYGDVLMRFGDKWAVPRIRIANLETQCSMKVNPYGSRNLMFKSTQTYKTKVKEGDAVVEKIEPIGAALVLLDKAMRAVFEHSKVNDLLSVEVKTKSFTNFMQTDVKISSTGSKKKPLPESEWSLRIEMPFESETKKVKNEDGKPVDKKISKPDAPLKDMTIKDLRRLVPKKYRTNENMYEDAGVENSDGEFDPIVFGNVDQFIYYGSKCSGLIEISASCSAIGVSVKPRIRKLLVLPAPPNMQTSDADATGDMILDTEEFVPKGATLLKGAGSKPAAKKPALHAFGDDEDLDGNDSEPEPPKKGGKSGKKPVKNESDDESEPPKKLSSATGKSGKKPAKVETPPASDDESEPKKPAKKPAKSAKVDSDDDEPEPPKKPSSATGKSGKKPAKVDSDDDEPEPPKKPAKKPAKVDSDDDEPEPPKKLSSATGKSGKKPAKKPADSDDDEPEPPKKPAKKPAKKPVDSDDDGDNVSE